MRNITRQTRINRTITVDGFNGMDPPLSSAAFMSQNGCGIVDNH
jgi:hypothetical protein